jgi:hypothetical protein
VNGSKLQEGLLAVLASNELEPLVLADGTKIDPTTGKKIVEKRPTYVEVPAPSTAQQMVIKANKSAADLPLPPKQMSAVGLVAFYTLFGLSDRDIALVVGNAMSVQQVQRIRELDVYKQFMEDAQKNILESERDNVRNMFQQHSRAAASKVIELANSDNDVLAFKASQDILDRAGHRPADVVEHRHRLENTLKIELIKRDDPKDIPIIEGDYETVSGS